MISRKTKILTTQGTVSLWRLRRDAVLKAFETVEKYAIKRRRGLTMYEYTITTYVGEYTITCTPDTPVVCEKESKPIEKIGRGDCIYVEGVARPARLTMVKSVKKRLSEEDMGAAVSVRVIADRILIDGEQLH